MNFMHEMIVKYKKYTIKFCTHNCIQSKRVL